MFEEIEKIKDLRGSEREVVAEIVLLLSEIYTKRLYVEAGYSSLFVFCKECLRYSEGASYRRVEASKALLVDPNIYHKLKDGTLSLCAAAELAKVLKKDNASEIVKKAAGKSKAEVSELVAELLPVKPEKKRREVIRVARRTIPEAPLLSREQKAEKSYSVTLEFSEEEMAVIREAQEVLSASKVKDALLGATKRLLLRREKLEKARERRAQIKTKGRRTSPEKLRTNLEQDESHSRYIPADTRHAVKKRDGRQCSYVSPEGVRCCETKHLEFDHLKPFSIGGESTTENLRLLCKAHNRLAAEKIFGREKIQKMILVKRQLKYLPQDLSTSRAG